MVRLDRLTKTANCKMLTISSCRLRLTSFTPAKDSKVGITVWSYGMYPKLIQVAENWNCLFPHTSSNPLSLLSLLSIPLLRVCDLWSKASRQQRCRLWVRREGERWEKKVREHTPPMSFQPHLLSEMLQSGCWDWINSSFLSSNTQFTGSILNGGTSWSQPISNEGAVSAFFVLFRELLC